MEELVVNELSHDGMRRMRVIGDGVLGSSWEELVPAEARRLMVMRRGEDARLGLHWLELSWPVFEPMNVFCHGPKGFRRLMMVNFAYGERVSECIELARVHFFARTKFAPGFAFVRELPEGRDGSEADGCVLVAAEWMPARCAAVGGR